MKNQRRKFTPAFKSRIVLEAISGTQTPKELAERFDLHQNQITSWKKEFILNAHLVFEKRDDVEDDETKI